MEMQRHTPSTVSLLRVALFIGSLLLLAGCSTGKMVVRGSQTIMDSGIEAMNSETDLQLARAAMPANLKLMEGMLLEDPDNIDLLLYALASAGKNDVPAIFWSASCLGKWVDMNRDNIAGIAGLSNVATLMQRVIELDETYYHGAAHMFFGVYYGGRAPMLGGDFALAEQHFRRAAEINNDKLLLVDLLQAEYLDRQQLNQEAFHQRLLGILEAPDDLYPQMALINAISKDKAALLLEYEGDWF